MTQPSDYVTLISSDGFSFVIQRSSACLSPVIKNMLDPLSTSEAFNLLPWNRC